MDYRERWELKDYLIGRRLERRIRLLHVLVALLLLSFLLDFWYLQGVRGEDYAHLAENNRLRRIPLKPTRGVIFDRQGEVIASTRPSLNLLLIREDNHDKAPQLARLAQVIGVSEERLLAEWRRMRGRPLFEPFVVAEDVGLREVAWIEARRELFPSVEIEERARRHYPHGPMLAHVLGFVGEVSETELDAAEGALASGDIVGKSGIERTYDDTVRGARGWKVVSVNNVGRQIGGGQIGAPPDHGHDLTLTLDLDLQRTLFEAFGEEAGAAVFLDPANGEVLALASTPAFDPNLFADGISVEDWNRITGDPRRPMHDRAIASYYAPGSIFKVAMAVAGLESGTIDADDTVTCPGYAYFYGRRRLCWKRGGHGTVAVREAVAKSCNVFFYELGQKLGIERIHDYGAKLGLGSPTGIDLPGEEPGILPNGEWKRRQLREIWYPGDTISVAIGQGYLTTTPVQMAVMSAAIANGGHRVTPHTIRGRGAEPVPLGFDADSMARVRGGMADAVALGTATRAALKGISVAGKTGTAQVSAHSAETDSDELPKQFRSHAWFVGYAPTERPRIAFAVIVEHGGHGGSSAAPIARQVLERFFAEEAESERERRERDSASLAAHAAPRR